MLDFLVKHKKAVSVCGILIFILIIAISVYFIVDDAAKTAKIDIVVTPSSATVKIDGAKHGTYGSLKIRPGKYQIEIMAEGFKTKTYNIEAVEGETAAIKVYLEPEEWNQDYYSKNPADGTIFGDLKAEEIMKKIEEIKKNNPILNNLPINVDYYTKNYSQRIRYTITYTLKDDNTDFTIDIIDYTGNNYEAALDRLESMGADLDKYTITYEDQSDDLGWGRAN